MTPIRITTRLESDTLVLPELRDLVGKMVEIRITEAAESALNRLIDSDYEADCAADPSPEVSLAEVRAGLASIAGTMTADFAAERNERLLQRLRSGTNDRSAFTGSECMQAVEAVTKNQSD